MLSHDPEVVCNYLGVSYARWQEGLRSEVEVFDWALQCRLHDPTLITRKMKASQRKRMKKRAFYRSFLEYTGVDCSTVEDNSFTIGEEEEEEENENEDTEDTKVKNVYD